MSSPRFSPRLMPGHDEVGRPVEQAQSGHAHAVHGSPVGAVGQATVGQRHFLHPQRSVHGDAAGGARTVLVGSDDLHLAERVERGLERAQPRGSDSVVVRKHDERPATPKATSSQSLPVMGEGDAQSSCAVVATGSGSLGRPAVWRPRPAPCRRRATDESERATVGRVGAGGADGVLLGVVGAVEAVALEMHGHREQQTFTGSPQTSHSFTGSSDMR